MKKNINLSIHLKKSSKEDVVIEVWEKQKKSSRRRHESPVQDLISNGGGSIGGGDLISNVDRMERLDRSDRLDRTDLRSDRGMERYDERKIDGDDIKRLKEDLINTIQ